MLAAALVLGMAIPRAAAQLTNGTVLGSVQDPQAAVVAGATVTLVSETRGTRLPAASTTITGEFAIPNVPPDTYTLEVASAGFKTLKRQGIAVSPGDRVGVGVVALEVGSAGESITVTSEAPLLQTQSSERSFTINQDQV